MAPKRQKFAHSNRTASHHQGSEGREGGRLDTFTLGFGIPASAWSTAPGTSVIPRAPLRHYAGADSHYYHLEAGFLLTPSARCPYGGQRERSEIVDRRAHVLEAARRKKKRKNTLEVMRSGQECPHSARTIAGATAATPGQRQSGATCKLRCRQGVLGGWPFRLAAAAFARSCPPSSLSPGLPNPVA
ncbi:hypothetical protein MTO96_020350 [Rhipicephalus appendiculatus]